MPDQPKFCVVPVEPSESQLTAGYEVLCSGDMPPNEEEHWEGWTTPRIYKAMIAARGPEAEAHVAVKQDLLEIVCHALEMEGAATFMWEGEEENFGDLANELRRALLNPAKE